ncbi:sugar efflux transporter [Deinococcus sp. KNUC1210]|uniref:sugar efflux transporter n=1 Tax=Deinococcus sp. KNUC1210 TaxID=2917691 RepID=UPI001EF13192|nr:sugar efflux transporter [Deinococcus sp. KNUC1210]ULH15730.1 sugar efflux transporter [Deinococcus sp. KNUC1210]
MQSTLTTLARLPNYPRLSLAVLLVGLSTSVAGPYIPLFASTQAHMAPLPLGIFMTLLAMSGVLISLLLGRWSDRLPNRKPMVLLAVGAAATGFLLLCVTRSYLPLLLIVCVFLGTGAASFPQLFALAKAQLQGADPQASEHGITTLRSVFSLAWVVGPGLGALLVGNERYNTLFLTTAGLYTATALMVLLARTPPAVNRSSSGRPLPVSGPQIALWKIVTSFVLYGTSLSMGALALPLYVTHVLHGTTGQVGFLLGLCALLEIPIMLSFVFLPRRFSTHSLIVFAFALLALYFVMLWAAPGIVVLAAAQLLRAIVIAIAASLGMTYFQSLMPGRIGAATTLFANTTSIGSMLAGVVSGGFAQAFGYRSVFLVCGVFTLLAWGLLYSAGRRATRAQRG